jgi:asparagine synthase (glutamine-hydrolysing)
MCGIVGVWNINGSPIDNRELDSFTDSLAHRGPDGRGVYIDPKVGLGLGHRRLAILDLSETGKLPMSFGDGRYWITYNGEVYNFIELRKELTELGHRFRSETDTEVVLAAYAEWGEDCQLRFNGMWAFAIWDSHKRTLFLSRDRFGVKPLHYLFNGKQFVFASELKAFMALNQSVRPEFDLGIMAIMGNIESAKKTFLKGVHILNGGNCLTLREGRPPAIRQWWHTKDHLTEVPTQFNDQVAQYKELFFDACKIRMRSDVPIGTALSGGLDSSSVLCTMANIRAELKDGQRLAENWQKAFVLDYTDTSHSERSQATDVINHTGAIPIFKDLLLSNISVEDIVQITYDLEAVQDPSIGPWSLYREMRRNSTVVSIDGHGGDETLAGYHNYPAVAMRDFMWPWSSKERLKDIQDTLLGLYEEEVPDGYDNFVNIPSQFDIMKSILTNKKQVLTSNLRNSLHAMPALYKMAHTIRRNAISYKQSNGPPRGKGWSLIADTNPSYLTESKLSGKHFDQLNRKLYNDFHIHVLPRILRNFDRLSMAHGVEIRAPFLDWRLVSYAFSLPSDAKIGDGFTKRILRESMRNILPENIRLRKGKIGFASPMTAWYEHSLKDFVLDSVNSNDFLSSTIWDGQVIRNFAEISYKKKNYQNATRSWKYIQTMILMKSFREKAMSWNSAQSEKVKIQTDNTD